MDIGNTIKHAPKWAWYTVGGIAVGGVGLRLWKSRTTSASKNSSTAATDPNTAASDPGSYNYGSGGVSGVIVPPVIMPQQNSTGDTTGLLGSVLAGVGDLTGLVLGSVETLIGPTQNSQAGLVDTIGSTWSTLATANAGGPPQQVQNAPPVVNTPVPPPAAPPPQGGSQVTLYDCPSKYPHHSDRGCYRTTCKDGHWWHYYAPDDSTKIKLAATC